MSHETPRTDNEGLHDLGFASEPAAAPVTDAVSP